MPKKEKKMAEFKYSFNSLVNYAGEPIGASIERIAKCGYDGIEVPGFDEVYTQAREIGRQCADAGLAVSSICSFFGAGINLAHPSRRIRGNSVDYMKRTVDFAAEVDCPTAIIYPGQFGKPVPLADYEDEKRWGIESMRAVAEYALPLGVNLCIEAWNRYDNHLINTLAQAKEWADEIGLENVGLQGDTFHIQFEESHPIEAIRNAGRDLIHMHFSENTRSAPGTGSMDFVPLLQVLKDIGYRGYITFEILPPAYDFTLYMETRDGSRFFDEYTKLSIDTLKKAEKKVK
jgi:sugar phosphate isomerase/epimerase